MLLYRKTLEHDTSQLLYRVTATDSNFSVECVSNALMRYTGSLNSISRLNCQGLRFRVPDSTVYSLQQQINRAGFITYYSYNNVKGYVLHSF